MIPSYDVTSGFRLVSNEELPLVNGGTGGVISRVGNAIGNGIRAIGRAVVSAGRAVLNIRSGVNVTRNTNFSINENRIRTKTSLPGNHANTSLVASLNYNLSLRAPHVSGTSGSIMLTITPH